MIEVTVIDSAECATPEAAVAAALTLGGEARKAQGIWGFNPRITFTVEGRIVRSTDLRSLLR